MINYKELVKKTGAVSIADLFIRLRPFIIIPLISKNYGAGVYGVWAQLMVTVTMVLPIVLLGLSFGLTRYLPGKSPDETREDLVSILSLVTLASIFGAAILAVMSSFLSRKFFGAEQLSGLIQISGLYLITMALREIFLSYFLAKEKQFIYSSVVISESLLSIGAIFGLISAGYGVKSILIALTVMNSLLILFSFFAIHKDVALKLPTFKNVKLYLKFSLPLVPSFLLLWVINWSDRYFLGFFKNMEDVGIYSACYGISYFVVFALIGPLYLVLEPRINNAWNNKKYQLAKKAAE